MTAEVQSKQRWVPLESNPDVLNKYVHSLGVPNEWQFVDVYGFDAELLMMVPRPVSAVMLLYPISKNSEDEGNAIGSAKEDSDAYFMKQTVGNACGTVALVHALANNDDKINFDANKHFSKFLAETRTKSSSERATCLESDLAMGAAHEDIAQEGQTKVPSRDDKLSTHFIVFVCKEGQLLELDGRKDKPIFHGSTSADTLLEDTVEVVKKFMARDPAAINFTVMALAKNG